MKTYLKAGKLGMIYGDGTLRYVSSGRTELLRMVYPALRDPQWLTIPPETEEETIEQKEDSFKIKLKYLYRSGEINFRATCSIEGNSDNTITFIMDGEALSAFRKNRIGICVLHPVEQNEGINCIIEHTDGSIEESVFPEEISPHQVFRDIRSMKWINKSIRCSLDFEGDVFETEDQRNWTDNSFKTYSTPLSLPYPVLLDKGTKIYQKIIFRADIIPEVTEQEDEVIKIRVLPDQRFSFPRIGIGRSTRGTPLSIKEIKILRSAGFDHYRTDIHLFSPDWSSVADFAHNESIELGWPLEIALFFSGNISGQAEIFTEWLKSRNPDVARILLYHRDRPVMPDEDAREIIKIIRKEFQDADIGTGTNANFAELNRNRPGDTGNDYICYSIHPQEHASDDVTLVENLKAQEYTIRSARTFAGRKSIAVSPVTIQRRFNANISFIEYPFEWNDLPPQTDPRLMTLFGACWTAGSIKYLCEADADSLTYLETAGERGIIKGETEPRWPGFFPSDKGMIFPVFHLFRFVLLHKNCKIVKSISSDPLHSDSLALSDDGEARLVIMNFTDSPQKIKIDGLSGMCRLIPLFKGNLKEAESDHRWTGFKYEKTFNSSEIFSIEPFSLNFIEGWLK